MISQGGEFLDSEQKYPQKTIQHFPLLCECQKVDLEAWRQRWGTHFFKLIPCYSILFMFSICLIFSSLSCIEGASSEDPSSGHSMMMSMFSHVCPGVSIFFNGPLNVLNCFKHSI